MFLRSFGQIVFRTPSGRPETFPKVLANLHIASRRPIFDVQTKNVQRLLVLSSVTVAELGLVGVRSLCVDTRIRMTTLQISQETPLPTPSTYHHSPLPLQWRSSPLSLPPSPCLIHTLSSISSAPVLTSVAPDCWWHFPLGPGSPNIWDRLDKWLSHMAKNSTVGGGFVMKLERWWGNLVPEEFSPGFRKVGKIKTDFSGWTRVTKGFKLQVVVAPLKVLIVSQVFLMSFLLKEEP